MITIKQKGDFSKLTRYLKKASKVSKVSDLHRYGQAGVKALTSATPVDSGKTAGSWYYEIKETDKSIKISFYNTNIQNGVPIAIIIQYGHATRSGGWIQGRDYINPAIQPIFDRITKDAWKEVTDL